jgi:hypothetical protein
MTNPQPGGTPEPRFSPEQDERLFALAGEGDPVDAPDGQKLDWVKSGLKFLGVNIGAFAVFKVLDCFESLAKGKKGGCSFMSPDQQKQVQLSVDQLAKLPDGELWTKLAGWAQNSPEPTPPAQYETVHFLQRARAKSSEFSMATHDKEALVAKLAGMSPDSAMYTYMSTFTYQGDAVPFSYGAGVLLSALLKKYPNDFQH